MKTIIGPPNIISSNARAFFTTKIILNENESIDEVIARELNVTQENIYLPIQKHTNKIHVLESGREPVIADAVVTAEKNILIGILVADCVPILMHDGHKEVIAAVHAGWRGTAQTILKNTIETMVKRYGSSIKDISIAIGPSIRRCSYVVGEDVMTEVLRATGEGDYYKEYGDKYFIDLSSANVIQALNMGIPQENIWQSDECTFCNPHKFYSYRYTGGTTGRQGGFIGMW